ncbi:MAG TPA: hypothetical protein VFV97_11235, partial [Rhodanobacteraceae bacterium]|nr:hypothetical protein [Rhodanobacteraceae bacterium]
ARAYLRDGAARINEDDPSRAAELAEAALAAAHGSGDAAAHFAAALAIADRHGAPDEVVETVIAELAWHLGRNDLEPAKALAGRLSQYADRDYDAARALAAFYRASGDAQQADSADAASRALAGERNPSVPI